VRHALVLASALAALLAATSARAQDTERAAEPILRQLEAFRRNDYDLAYTFASAEIQSMFDRAGFERMVKSGYPEIADSTSARVVERQVAPDGHVFVLVKIRGANGRVVEALYEMVWDGAVWKINGVVARTEPGEEVRAGLSAPAGARAAPRAAAIV